MELFPQKKVLDLAYDLFVRGRADVSRVPYTPSKTVICPPAADYFPRAIPEFCGIESDRLTAMLSDLEHSNRVNLHSITVLADGAVVCEASAPGYDRHIPHVTHSMCKTITGLAIGMLWDEGLVSLDTPAYSFFPADALPSRLSGKTKAITVQHLLTMSSGVSFAEAGAVTDTDWVRAFFSSDLKFDPGSDFAYNSMNTYILSAIVRAVSGAGLVDYLRPRLLDPLHIESLFWEKCPKGIEKGGWGLYIAGEDAAKIGQTFLDRGLFEGKRIISEEWLVQACACQRITPAESGDYNYAYQMWYARDNSGYLFNGMLGQNVWVCPQNRIVIVTNAGNNEFFQRSSMLSIFAARLGVGFTRAQAPLAPNRHALRRLRQEEDAFFSTRRWAPPLPAPGRFTRFIRRLYGKPEYPLPALCGKLEGISCLFPQNNSGILPLFMRLMQNNHTAGLHALSFEREGERFFACFDEGEGEVYRIEANFYGYTPAILRVRGEVYRIQSCARFAVDEDGRRLLKLDIVFPEFSHTRRVKIYFDDEQILLSLREVPGKEVVDGLLRALPIIQPRSFGFLNFLRRRLNLDYFLLKTYDKFEPILRSPRGEEELPVLPAGGEETPDEADENERDADPRTEQDPI